MHPLVKDLLSKLVLEINLRWFVLIFIFVKYASLGSGLNWVQKDKLTPSSFLIRATGSVPTGICSSGWTRKRELRSIGEPCQPALVRLLIERTCIINLCLFLVTHIRKLYPKPNPDDDYEGFHPSSPVIRNSRRRKWDGILWPDFVLCNIGSCNPCILNRIGSLTQIKTHFQINGGYFWWLWRSPQGGIWNPVTVSVPAFNFRFWVWAIRPHQSRFRF